MRKLNVFITAIAFIGLVGCESDSKGEYKSCADSEVYDASLNACRKMICEDLGYKTCEGKNGCFEPDTIYTCGNCNDCTTIEHATGDVSCQNGKCEFECEKGYQKDELGTSCEEICKSPLGDCNGDDICETHLDEYGLKSCSACADEYAACGETKTSDGIAIPLCLKLKLDTKDENIKEVTKIGCNILCNYDDWQPRYETADCGKNIVCENSPDEKDLQYVDDCTVDNICPKDSEISATYIDYYAEETRENYAIHLSFTPQEELPGNAAWYLFKVANCKKKQRCQLNTNGYDEEHMVYYDSKISTYPFDIECVDE